MGLDMFLKKCVDGEREEIFYWRKANQVRQWFVDHTDYPVDGNCIDHPLTKDDLTELMLDCLYVLTHRDEAPELMPTSSGFFFGSTEYDEYYFDDLKSTAEGLQEILATTNFDEEEVFYSEWW